MVPFSKAAIGEARSGGSLRHGVREKTRSLHHTYYQEESIMKKMLVFVLAAAIPL
jgi:hypothetical protein